jgi:multisubunit Na+/H+ antiporter MnhC subunit
LVALVAVAGILRREKMFKIMAYSLVLLLLGNFLILLGNLKGKVWATNFNYHGSNEVREGIANAFVYTPIILGISLILLSLIIFSVTFHQWVKKYL